MFLTHVKFPSAIWPTPSKKLLELLSLSELLLQHFLSLHECLCNACFSSACIICAKFVHSCFFSIWGLPVPPWPLVGVSSLLKQWQLCVLNGPPCFLQWMQCLSVHPTLLGFLGMQESINSNLAFPFGPFCLGRILGLEVHFCIVLNALKYQ